MDRREFLRSTGLSALSLPLASAILAACGTNTSTSSTVGGVDFSDPARLDNPVTLPVDSADLIADGLKPEAGPLELYNWEEYINPRVVALFEEKYGVKVNVNTFNTMSDAIATLTTAKDVNFDVFVADVDQLGKLAASRTLRPLNMSYVPNLANTWDRYSDTTSGPFYDVGAHYSVPYVVYSSGIGWRIDEGGPSESFVQGLDNTWDLLWDDKWKGKIHILDDYREAIAMAMQRAGINDVNTDDAAAREQSLAGAQQALLDLVEAVDVKADISDYTDLPEGISLIHHGWSGDFLAAQWYFPKDITDKDVIRYWTPEQNSIVGNDLMTILANGKNPVLAHLFLDFMLDFDMAMTNFQWNGYVPPQKRMEPDKLIRGAGESYSIVPPGLLSAITTEDDLNSSIQLLELSPDVDSQWKDVWETFQTA